MGGIPAVLFPVFLYFSLRKQSEFHISSIWFMLFTLSSLVALVLSLGRASFMSALVGTAVVLVWHKKTLTMNHVVLLGILSVLCIMLFVSTNTLKESIQDRELLLSASYHIVGASPWIGVGLGNFLTALPSYTTERTIFFLQPVHNIYMLVLSEIGIIGVFLFGVWAYMLRGVRAIDGNKNALVPFLLGFAVWFAMGLVDHYALTVQQGQLFTVVLFSLVLLPDHIKTS
jgi:hypothetical protein